MSEDKDKAPIEAIAEPWICVEEKPCEEAVAVHWEEMVTSLSSTLATVRREAREEAFKDAAGIAANVILPPSLREARDLIVSALERAADSREGGRDGE